MNAANVEQHLDGLPSFSRFAGITNVSISTYQHRKTKVLWNPPGVGLLPIVNYQSKALSILIALPIVPAIDDLPGLAGLLSYGDEDGFNSRMF